MKLPRFPLAAKFALLALLLPVVPLAALRMAGSMQHHLLAARQQSMATTAQAVAALIDNRPALFGPASGPPAIDTYPLQRPIVPDGHADDWGNLLPFATELGPGRQGGLAGQAPANLSVNFLAGRFGNDLYLLFMVDNDRVVYRPPSSRNCDDGDHLLLGLSKEGGLLDLYGLCPDKAGPLGAFLLLDGPKGPRITVAESRIQGFWWQTESGYILELRLPLELTSGRLSVAVADVDDPSDPGQPVMTGIGGFGSPAELALLPADNKPLENLLVPLLPPGAGILVVDRQNTLRALAGGVEATDGANTAGDDGWPSEAIVLRFSPLLHLFDRESQPAANGRLDFDALLQKFAGKKSPPMLGRDASGRPIVTVARPLSIGGDIRGTVVVERAAGDILAAGDRMTVRIVLAAAVVGLFGLAVLLFFGARLGGRIRRLNGALNHAVGRDGRILRSLAPSAARDEVGEFSRHLAVMVERLREFHRYQEKMADNLEHELRTPLAGVSASLTNLCSLLRDQDASVSGYLDDARRNMRRLEDILTRIREAAAIKDALQGDEQEKFDLRAALAAWVAGYRKTFPAVSFSLSTPDAPLHILADPNRIYQLMDKLVENAADFSPTGATVEISLAAEQEFALIRVRNEGPELDENQADQLFHSMVSFRAARNGERLHMGLGLFIARAIVEFHGGSIRAAKRGDGVRGAVFSVRLPLHDWAKNITIRR